MTIALILVLALLGTAFVLALARVLMAREPADRVVAAELLTGLVIAAIALAGWQQWGVHALDAAIGLALVGFLGSVALAETVAAGEPTAEPPTDGDTP